MFDRLLAAAAATTWQEAAAVVLGVLYVGLAIKRNRWCWVAGGLSSAIFAYLAINARLPMQSGLQAYYVIISFYGWWHWSRAGGGSPAVGTWSLRSHVIAVAACIVASLVAGRWLAAETHAAWPFLDSFATALSLVATFLEARVKLENWLYFFVVDCMLVFLFAAQDLYFSALLFGFYVVICLFGYTAWLRRLRLQPTPQPA